jgi:UDP-N-acetyl-2-amino-2-deoxyglucuronate dehydrogenase
MKVIKIGLIGCGTITIKAHIPALLNDPTAKLSAYNYLITAICGLEQSTLDYIKSMLPQVTVFQDYHDLIEKGDCDAVLIATGEEIHPMISKAALDKGLFVLCEKPFAINTGIVQSFIDSLTDKQKAKIQIGFNKRYYPVLTRYKQLQEKKEFGNPITGSFNFVTQQGRKPGWDGLLSNLIHYCDLICAIFGEVNDISAKVSKYTDSGISVTASMMSENGASISLLFTSAGAWNASFHEEWQVIDTNRKRIVSRNGNETYFFDGSPDYRYWGDSNSIFWLPDSCGYKTQLKAFYQLCCGELDVPVPGINDALRAHQMFDEIRMQCEKS